MEKKSPAREPTSPPIPCEGGSGVEDGIPAPESGHASEARVGAPNPPVSVPGSPAAIRAILDDLHGFIAYGESILGELASDPSCFAPPRSLIRLEAWLFYLSRRVFPGLDAFETTGSKIPVKPADFSPGPTLSAVPRYLDQAAINSCLGSLNRSIEQYNHLSPLRPVPRPPRPNRKRIIDIEADDKSTTPSRPWEDECSAPRKLDRCIMEGWVQLEGGSVWQSDGSSHPSSRPSWFSTSSPVSSPRPRRAASTLSGPTSSACGRRPSSRSAHLAFDNESARSAEQVPDRRTRAGPGAHDLGE